jgi:hypothetical protein
MLFGVRILSHQGILFVICVTSVNFLRWHEYLKLLLHGWDLLDALTTEMVFFNSV